MIKSFIVIVNFTNNTSDCLSIHSMPLHPTYYQTTALITVVKSFTVIDLFTTRLEHAQVLCLYACATVIVTITLQHKLQ